MEFNSISTSVSDRVKNLLILPPAVIFYTVGGIGFTCLGVAAHIIATATFSKFEAVNKRSILTRSSRFLLPNSFSAVMNVVNPDVSSRNKDWFSDPKSGFVSQYVAFPILKTAIIASNDDKSILNRHVVSRVGFGLFGVVSVVTRTTDLAIGILAAVLSLATLGVSQKVNEIAVDHLSSLRLVGDLCFSVTGVLNPAHFKIPSLEAKEQTED